MGQDVGFPNGEAQMVKYCTVAILGATGDFPVKPKTTFLSFWPMPQLLIYVLPWPKGAPTAPEFIIEDDGDLDERRAALKATIESLISRGETQKLEPTPSSGHFRPRIGAR